MRPIKEVFERLDNYYNIGTQDVNLNKTDREIKRNIFAHNIPKTTSPNKDSVFYTYVKHLNRNITYSVLIALLLENLYSETSTQ